MPHISGKVVNEEQFCSKCSALTGSLKGLLAACSAKDYLHHRPSKLHSTSKTCVLCKKIKEARPIDNDLPTSNTHLRLHALSNRKPDGFRRVHADDKRALRSCSISAFEIRTSDPYQTWDPPKLPDWNLPRPHALYASTAHGKYLKSFPRVSILRAV